MNNPIRLLEKRWACYNLCDPNQHECGYIVLVGDGPKPLRFEFNYDDDRTGAMPHAAHLMDIETILDYLPWDSKNYWLGGGEGGTLKHRERIDACREACRPHESAHYLALAEAWQQYAETLRERVEDAEDKVRNYERIAAALALTEGEELEAHDDKA